MKSFLKKIYTILVLIKNVTIRKKHYKLHFVAEVDPPIKRWYYDFKHWGFSHDNLEMVSGADTLCEKYANGDNEVTVEIMATDNFTTYDHKTWDKYTAEELPKDYSFYDKYAWGREYTLTPTHDNYKEKVKMWICPVTLFVLGRYPKYIYIKKTNV